MPPMLDEYVARFARQVDARLARIEDRMLRLEEKVSRLEGMGALARWLVPLALALAAILIDHVRF